ncbi:MAG TPA: alpha/beta fold hydrolase [Chthonomonadaceae bacterium]|nr:alpha/beta fold hydrolase [Chthonomonadaceae bacterium]
MNPENRGARPLVIGTIVLVVCSVGIIYLARMLALARIAEANPLRHASRLRGIPTLIHYRELDWRLPPEEHSLKMAEAIGPSCKARLCPNMGYIQAMIFDPRDIMAFLEAHAEPKMPVLLLHGRHQTAAVWTQLLHSSQMIDNARLKMAEAICKDYACRPVEIGPDSWGNDASLAALDREAGPTGKVVLLGESMGAVTMWRWAEKHPARVAALVGITPVCDLTKIATGPWGREARRAYGSL